MKGGARPSATAAAARGWAALYRKLTGPRRAKGGEAAGDGKTREHGRTWLLGCTEKEEEKKRRFFLFSKQEIQTRFKRNFESNQPKIKCSSMYATMNSYVSLFN
jgi:hypothetical protein